MDELEYEVLDFEIMDPTSASINSEDNYCELETSNMTLEELISCNGE